MPTTSNSPKLAAEGPGPPPVLFERIRASIQSTRAPSPRTGVRIPVALAIVPIAAVAVLGLAARVVYGRPLVRLDLAFHLAGALVLLVALTLAVTLIAVRRGSLGLGADVVLLLTAAVLVAPIYSALTLWSAAQLGGIAAPGVELSPWGLPCLSISAVVGAVVLAALTAALRHAVPVATRLRAATLGAAAGAWAGLTVFVFCPAGDHQHLIVGHILPYTLLGPIVAARALRP
jgi:hypothetical protein